FAPGQTSQTITVAVNGDNVVEPDEAFFVNLSDPSGALIEEAQGLGTILKDDPPPSLGINDVSLSEGKAGTTNAVCMVSLSNPSAPTVTVSYATADDTALAGRAYAAGRASHLFAPGQTSQTITVAVNGDNVYEPDKVFFVNLSNASGA